MNPIIEVRNLGKRYRIGTRERGYKTFREAIVDGVTAPFRNFAKLRRLTHFSDNGDTTPDNPSPIADSPSPDVDTIWALRDVSFDVMPGEVVGIIGRNGAGKSTLLKILSRITEPTTGNIRIYGRVSSLLEVGTGFHPELTGRENLFLNGAILGMHKNEIEKKFDEIVDFAEIEKFIDTPVKRYSSGMYVRLAFAVAAHLEPEILVVDEVLAVGDANFQKKCMGKMGDVARLGRTVLFVSHNLVAIRNLCGRAMLLEQGRLVKNDASAEVVNEYYGSGIETKSEQIWDDPVTAPGNEIARLHRVCLKDEAGAKVSRIGSDDTFYIEFEYWNLHPNTRLGTTVLIFSQDGTMVLGSLSNHEPRWHSRPRPAGLFRSSCQIPGRLLNVGRYSVSVVLYRSDYSGSYRKDECAKFEIHDTAGVRGDYMGVWGGVIRPLLEWQTEYVDDER